MTLKLFGLLFAVITAIVVIGCSGAAPENRSPSADEIKAAQQSAVAKAESNPNLSPQQKAAIEQHLGGVQPQDAGARSSDLRKK